MAGRGQRSCLASGSSDPDDHLSGWYKRLTWVVSDAIETKAARSNSGDGSKASVFARVEPIRRMSMTDDIPHDHDLMVSPDDTAVVAKAKAEASKSRPLSDEEIEVEIDLDEAALAAGKLDDDLGASHQGGAGAQGGQTDFGNPRKFAGRGT